MNYEGLDVSFPCIIKPSIMHVFFKKFNKKVIICKNKKELIENIKMVKMALPYNEIMIQEIISGSYDCQYSVGLLVINNMVKINLVAKRNRQHPLNFGNATTNAYSIDDPGILNLAKKIVLESGYNGICEVEFMLDNETKTYKLLEINPRTWKWHTLQIASKSPFILSYYQYLKGETSKINTHLHWVKANWIHWSTDTYIKFILRRRKLPIRQLRNVESQYAVRSSKDPLPFIAELLLLPYLLISRT